MQIEKIQFDKVRYNPERGAFETLVVLHDDGKTYSYPVQLSAPLNAEYAFVARGLAEAARRAHLSGTSGLRARRKTERRVAVPSGPGHVTTLMERLLGHVAA